MSNVRVDRSDQDWIRELRDSGEMQEQAVLELRRLLLRGLRGALSRYPTVTDAHREDFVQEALIKILASLDSYRGESRFLTWAVKIAVRVAFSEMRRHRWKDISLDQILDGTPDGSLLTGVSGKQEPEAQYRQIREILNSAIQNDLSQLQNQVLTAHLVQGIQLDEIARRLGKTRNHAYKILHDARKRLKGALSSRGITASDVEFAFQGE